MRHTEHSLNNWVSNLDIYSDREDWEKGRFSGTVKISVLSVLRTRCL